MDFKLLPLLILSWVSGHPSVDRYITELPSHWDYDMVADQPYVPIRPSSYIYQIDDPSANYIYSSKFWDKKDLTYHARRSGSETSKSTPTHGPKSTYDYEYYSYPYPYTSTPSMTVAVPLAPVIPKEIHIIHFPVIRRILPWYPSNYNYYYAGNVYTTPYEFSGTASTFVQPNVLYSSYLTYSKPVYVVNNPYVGYAMPSYVYFDEYPKTTHQQPVHEDGDATKIQNNDTAGATEKIPTKIEKKPIRTNLTEIVIDPATEARKLFDGRRRNAGVTIDSEIIHKQRPNYYNTFGMMYHKSNKISDQN